MDHTDATIALGLINDYWPARQLTTQQLDTWATAITTRTVTNEDGTRTRVPTNTNFEQLCELIETTARESSWPPTIADLLARLREPPGYTNHKRPPVTDRGRAIAAHVQHLASTIGQRLNDHNHHNSWEHCPVCSDRSMRIRCGYPDCYCATGAVELEGEQ